MAIIYFFLMIVLLMVAPIAYFLFLFGIAVAIAVVTGLLLILNKQVKKTNWYKNSIPDMDNYPDNDWYRKHLERNFDIVNIGSSSYKYAFNYTGCPVKAFNWAEQPQSLTNGFKILKNYFSILKKGGKVVIALGPFSGLNVDGKWNKTANDKYCYILNSTLVDNYQQVYWRRRFPILFLPIPSLKRLIKDIPVNSFDNKGRKCVDFNKDAERWVESWKVEFGINDLDAPLSSDNRKGQKYRIQLLQQIIDFCLERNLQPVLVIPPMHPALAVRFSESFLENYILYFIKQANYKQIPFYNYMNDKRFHDDKYFYNAFLMNEEGAKAFTSIFLKQLLTER